MRLLNVKLSLLYPMLAPRGRRDGERFIVRADEKPTAFLEIEEQLRPVAE